MKLDTNCGGMFPRLLLFSRAGSLFANDRVQSDLLRLRLFLIASPDQLESKLDLPRGGLGGGDEARARDR